MTSLWIAELPLLVAGLVGASIEPYAALLGQGLHESFGRFAGRDLVGARSLEETVELTGGGEVNHEPAIEIQLLGKGLEDFFTRLEVLFGLLQSGVQWQIDVDLELAFGSSSWVSTNLTFFMATAEVRPKTAIRTSTRSSRRRRKTPSKRV